MAKELPDDDDAPPIYKHPTSKIKDKGQQEAKKGDIKTGKEIIGDEYGTDNEYEHIGVDPAGVEKNDPRAGTREDHDEAYRAHQEWRENGKKGPTPVIEDMTTNPDTQGTWRLRDKPSS